MYAKSPFLHTKRAFLWELYAKRRFLHTDWLKYQDSNLDWQNQNL